MYIIFLLEPELLLDLFISVKGSNHVFWCGTYVKSPCPNVPPERIFWAIRSASRSKNVLRQKTIKVDFCLIEWFESFIVVIQSFIFLNFTHFVLLLENARIHLKAHIWFFAKIFGKKSNKCLQSAPSVLMYEYKNVNIKKYGTLYSYNKALKPLS